MPIIKEQLAGSNQAKPTTLERRAAPRHSILQRCLVWPGIRGADPRLPGGWPCIAFDISSTGIALTLPIPLHRGKVLEVEAWGLPKAQLLQVRVLRTVPVAFLWFCGCELAQPLDEEELRAWMMGPRDWLPNEPFSDICSHPGPA
jgi:PilZ domain